MQPEILMLGWEHPPFFNGGLGVASTALAEALSSKVKLRLLVPKSGILPQAPAYELIGLNTLKLPPRRIWVDRSWEEKLKKVKIHYVEVDLRGYETKPNILRKEVIQEDYLKIKRVAREEREIEGPFLIDELYGKDLFEKVLEYTEIIGQLSRKVDFDIIHAHDWMTFLAGMEIKAYSGKPLLLHVHSLQYDRGGPKNRDLIYEIERHAMNQADGVIAVSAYTKGLMQRYYGISGEKIHVVHNGLVSGESYRAEKPFREKLVVFLGRMTGQKGPRYFFEAAKILLAHRQDLRFMMAGKGELIEGLIEETAREGLGDRLHFTGFLEPDRVRELLAMADVYVMPSVSEPFGLTALEAAQMGVPVILSQTSGAREVLSHAIAIDYQKTDTLAKTIGGILDDPLWQRQIVEGQKKDLQSLAWEDAADQVLELYRHYGKGNKQTQVQGG